MYCIELNKHFESKNAMFKALKSSSNEIIALKKAAINNSVLKGQLSGGVSTSIKSGLESKSLQLKEGYIYPVINTTRYIDSHNDVHIDGLWNKSAKEQNGRVFYVTDHNLSVNSVIAWKDDVNILVQDIPWSAVGKSYEGTTEALIFEIKKDSIRNEQAKFIIESKKDVENSVRMQYVSIRLAIDSNDDELAENKAIFDKYIDSIANKDVALELGYFWAVTEAKIVMEGSMVLAGSNDATSIIQPEKSTDINTEPEKSTQARKEYLQKKKEAIDRVSSKIESVLNQRKK